MFDLIGIYIMILTLQRNLRGDRYTMGTLAINGEPFCDTLEPTDRHLTAESITPHRKVYGQTAIPTGTYAMDLTYSPRFMRQLPLLRDVPCFEGVRIHMGNTCKDTAGCILVGRCQGPGLIVRSRDTLRRLMTRLERREPGEPLTIEVKGSA